MFRKEKVDSLIKRELNAIILKEIDIFPGILVTITRVQASANLFEAGIYISVVPEEKFNDVFSLLYRHVYDIQQILNKRLKMRPVPKIIFKKETKTTEAAKIEQLLFEIQKKESGKN
ncbi:MAG: 30S ribosome-binding factor RbfA [Candidatus Paceibacterota bacterium]|jgi:ribosome-binding factor A